jgi:hypothetical protein
MPNKKTDLHRPGNRVLGNRLGNAWRAATGTAPTRYNARGDMLAGWLALRAGHGAATAGHGVLGAIAGIDVRRRPTNGTSSHCYTARAEGHQLGAVAGDVTEPESLAGHQISIARPFQSILHSSQRT